MPQPQQRGIRASSATYITAHGNAGSLTHWVGLGIEPEFSWLLVGFVFCCATVGTFFFFFLAATTACGISWARDGTLTTAVTKMPDP